MLLRMKIIFSIFLTALFSGCSTINQNAVFENVVYRVQAGDVLNIGVQNEPDISQNFKISGDGFITHPLLGQLDISDLTLIEVEALVSKLLKNDYFVDPLVSVAVVSSTERPILIFGEVRSEGAYGMIDGRPVTILQIIARAGGFTDIASKDRVHVMRLVDGKKQTIRVRVNDLLRGKHGVTDLTLVSGDVVNVPESIF